MRNLLLAVAVLVLVVPATAQNGMPSEFGVPDQYDFWARIGEGDIATTEVAEGAGWNVAEYVRFSTEGGEHRILLASDSGEVVDVSCACGNATAQGMEIVIPDAGAGNHTVRLVRNFPATSGVLVDFALYGGQVGYIIAYVPNGHHVDTSAQLLWDPPWNCTSAPCRIHEYETSGGLHFAILPGPAPGGTIIEADESFPYLPVVLGILGGILLWAFLVQRGLVQRRRRQEVTTAAHKTAATEGKDVLEARKRVLMAGLKELEMAKMNKQVDDATYDKLKSELKRQTVTVMRALEEAT